MNRCIQVMLLLIGVILWEGSPRGQMGWEWTPLAYLDSAVRCEESKEAMRLMFVRFFEQGTWTCQGCPPQVAEFSCRSEAIGKPQSQGSAQGG